MILEEIYKLSRDSDNIDKQISLTIIDELLTKGSFNLTVTELGNKTGCSQPTASRYAKKLNATSYKKMVKLINEQAPSYFSKNLNQKNDLQSIKKELIDAVEQTLLNFDPVTINQIAQKILEASRINVVGMGGNISIKQEIEHKLSQIGKSPMLAIDWHQQMINLNYMNSQDLVILISYSGEKEETLKIAKESYQRKIPLVLFTGNFHSELEQYATYQINIYSQDPKYRSFSFSARPAIVSAWELIFKQILMLDDVRQEILEAWSWKNDIK